MSETTEGNVRQVAVKAFFRIAEMWKLSEEQQMVLLGLDKESFGELKEKLADYPLTEEAVLRISCLLGIYRYLQLLLSDTYSQDKWMTTPNQAEMFGGRSAIEFICESEKDSGIRLERVRRYLQGQTI